MNNDRKFVVEVLRMVDSEGVARRIKATETPT
jgi:hypothetical protein